MLRISTGVVLGLTFAVAFRTATSAPVPEPTVAGKEPIKLDGHTKNVTALAFSPDGKKLAASDCDGIVRIWDVSAAKSLFVLRADKDQTFAVAFAPDGKTVASAGTDNVIRLWDLGPGDEARQLEGDLKTGRVAHELKGHTDCIDALAFAPDGKLLASGSYDGTIRLWDTAKWEETRVLKGHEGHVTSIAFAVDGKRLLSGGVHKQVIGGRNTIGTGVPSSMRWWDVAEGKELLKTDAQAAHVAISSDGKTAWGSGLFLDIQQGSINGLYQATQVDVESGKVLRSIKPQGGLVAVSSDGKLLATGGWSLRHWTGGYIGPNNGRNNDYRVRLWDAQTGKERAIVEVKRGEGLVFSPDGKWLAAGSDNLISVWSVDALLRDSADGK